MGAVRSRLDSVSSLQYRFHYLGNGTMAGEYRGSMKIRPASNGGRPSIRARVEDWSSGGGQPDSVALYASDGTTVTKVDETGAAFLSAPLDAGGTQVLVNAYWGLVIEFIADKPLFVPGKSRLEDLGTESVAGVECRVVRQLTDVPGGRTRIDWWLGREDAIPRRQTWTNEIAEAPGEMTLDFVEMKIDEPALDSEFVLTAPDSFQVQAWDGPDIAVGQPAPSFSLKNRAGETVTLEQLRGRLVVLSFWASWCPKCRQLKGELEEIAARHAQDPLSVVGINVWEVSDSDLNRYLQDHNPSYTILLQGDPVAASYRLPMLPGLFLIGPDGRFLEVDSGVGWRDLSELRKKIKSHLPQSSS